jgi:hypothetical protein
MFIQTYRQGAGYADMDGIGLAERVVEWLAVLKCTINFHKGEAVSPGHEGLSTYDTLGFLVHKQLCVYSFVFL